MYYLNMEQVRAVRFVSFFFDSTKISDDLYGGEIFNELLRGKELCANTHRVIISQGDLLDNQGRAIINLSSVVVNDDLLTVTIHQAPHSHIAVVAIEDINTDVAKLIDTRFSSNLDYYLGMTSIDPSSTCGNRQFWKSLVRSLSIEKDLVTLFCTEQEMDRYVEKNIALDNDNIVQSDEQYNPDSSNELGEYPQTRQSSAISNPEQREMVLKKYESVRQPLELNFALVKEVELSGVQIWNSIEFINKAAIRERPGTPASPVPPPSTPNDIFMSLYLASQGVERLLKICVELIVNNSLDCEFYDQAENLLKSHRHVSLLDFVCRHTNQESTRAYRHLTNQLQQFYNNVRYSRYKESVVNDPEIRLIWSFAERRNNDIGRLKHRYATELGELSHFLYRIIDEQSHELSIFVYELAYSSTAIYVFTGEDPDLLNKLEEIEYAKKELLWYLIRNGVRLPISVALQDAASFEFDPADINDFISDLLEPQNSNINLLNNVQSMDMPDDSDLDESRIEEARRRRKETIGYIGDPSIHFEEETDCETS